VVLNTNCNAKDLGGCGMGSPQETWLKEDLAKRPSLHSGVWHTLSSAAAYSKDMPYILS